MARTLEDIESEILQLDRYARAALVKSLLVSLETLSDAEFDTAWAEEGESRYADFKAGATSAVDGDDVFARARARKG